MAALGERRLGARPRRARSARCGRTRSSSTSTRPHNPTGTLMPREVLDARRRALRRARRVALLRRGLPRARARPGRPPAGRVRSLRARAVARLDVEDLRPARAAARLARLAATARRCSASSTSSTTRRSARARRASSSARSRSGTTTALAERNRGIVLANLPLLDDVLRAARRRALVGAADGGPDRLPARCTAWTTRRRSVSELVADDGRAAAARRRLRRAGPRPRRLRARGHARGAASASKRWLDTRS